MQQMNDDSTRDIKPMEEIFADTLKQPEGVACIHLGTREELRQLKDDLTVQQRLGAIEEKLNLLLVHLKVDCPGMIITVPTLCRTDAKIATVLTGGRRCDQSEAEIG